LIILISLVLVGLFYANLSFARVSPGGNDFLVHWVGSQELIMTGNSPYTDAVALRIQTIAYGRPAQPGEHELRVAYPIYSALIFAPFALIQDFTFARAAWMTFLEACVFLLAVVSISLTKWKPSWLVLVIYFIFAFIWYHSVRPLINGNAVILVALLITLAFWAISRGQYELAGILLGLATIKPQVVILIWIFITLWGISTRRWKLLAWSYGTVFVLTIIGIIFIPDWILQNFYEVLRYPAYNPPGTPGAAFYEWVPGIGRQLGWGITLIVSVVLIIEWVATWRKDYEWFLWAACLTLVASQWIGIQTDPGNFIVLFFPLVYVMVNSENRWGKNAQIVSVLFMVFITIGLWFLFLSTVQYGDQPQQHSIMFFPLPLILFIGLYWVRWWATRPRRPLVEALKAL
jgi:hypothetical protein